MRSVRLTAGAAVVVLSLVGCGATDNGGAVAGPGGAGGTGSTLPAASLHSDLPAATAAAGSLKVALEPGEAPLSSSSPSGQTTGLDIELVQAVARLLGVTLTYVPESPTAAVADVRADKVDLGVGVLVDTPASRVGGLHFLDYLRGALAVLVRAGNPNHVGGLNDLCGRHVGVVDVSAASAMHIADACASSGRPVQFSGSAQPNVLAERLASGQVEAVVEDSLVASYAAQASVAPTELAVVGSPGDPALYGIALANVNLARAVAAALTGTLSDGTYARILDRWGAQGAAVTAMSTDGGT